MHSLRPAHYLAFLALSFWLLSNWTGAHGHLCFDGQEPPLAAHIDVMGDHLGHHDDQPHVDADLTPAKPVLAKSVKFDQPILLLALVTLLLSSRPLSLVASPYLLLISRRLTHNWPPLRAPPAAI